MIHRWRFYNFRATLRVPQVPLIRTTECQWSQLCPNFPPRFRSRRTAQRDHITAGSILLQPLMILIFGCPGPWQLYTSWHFMNRSWPTPWGTPRPVSRLALWPTTWLTPWATPRKRPRPWLSSWTKLEIATSGQFSTFAMFLFQPFDFSSSELPRLCELTLSWGFRAAAGIKDGEIKSKTSVSRPWHWKCPNPVESGWEWIIW